MERGLDRKTGTQGLAVDRSVLSDEQWERVAPLLPGTVGDPGRSGADHRRFLEAVLWIARTGSPWRDLHDRSTNALSALKGGEGVSGGA